MELKGLAKQGRNVAVAMAACGMVLGVTAPVAGAQDEATWEMPGLKEELLQDAVDSVIATAGEQNIRFRIYSLDMNQVIYNYTNWIVCAQAPAAEKSVEITPKPQQVTFAVKRPAAGC